MCGRYTLSSSGETVAEAFDLREVPQLQARFNIAPTQEVAAVRRLKADADRRLDFLHWGLIPFWAKDPGIGNRMINARSETAAEKPSFRNAIKKRRCLVVADGFYEWKKAAEGPKQPFHIRMKDGRPFAFAGLWEHWEGDEGVIDSCTLLTTKPNPLMAEVHDRMPVILPPESYDLWLDPTMQKAEQLEPLLTSYPQEEMEAYPVSRFVNKPGNDEPRCIESVA